MERKLAGLMKKYANRTSPVINRQSYNVEAAPQFPNWMDEFARNLEKSSVHSRERDQSLYDQISSIISGNRSKYPSVEAAVQDMHERTGLSALQNQIRAEKKEQNKKA
ncbi:MAG TPA: hypothetical protein VNW06_01795, partial [Cytophagaceae bacterium]|nr:hypothetical protein [Cytophagaceae bacterium]